MKLHMAIIALSLKISEASEDRSLRTMENQVAPMPIEKPITQCPSAELLEPFADFVTNPEAPTKPTRFVEPFCAQFNKPSYLHGFAPCPGYYDNINVISSNSQSADDKYGQGGVGDFYLHLTDRSHASLACGQGDFVGDWSEIASERCYNLCFDIRFLYDGCRSSFYPKSCPLGTQSNPYLEITPKIILQGGAPNYYRAVFSANFKITDDDGDRGGWHKVCAPIAPLDRQGNLPSNSQGEWSLGRYPCNTLGGSQCTGTSIPPNSAWNDLLSSVTAINLPIDFISNPAERIGYDNICIVEGDCVDKCDPNPLCYWQHEWDCKNVKTLETWPKILSSVRTFDEKTCVCKILEQCCPDRCDMAEQEFLALLLNLATDRLKLDCCVRGDCRKQTNVKNIMFQVDELLSSYPRSEYECSQALELLSGINEDVTLCDERK